MFSITCIQDDLPAAGQQLGCMGLPAAVCTGGNNDRRRRTPSHPLGLRPQRLRDEELHMHIGRDGFGQCCDAGRESTHSKSSIVTLAISLCRRMKAAFAKYKEEQLPILRQDKPGLKLTQYQDMIFKNWQKSPQNPLVRAQLAGK